MSFNVGPLGKWIEDGMSFSVGTLAVECPKCTKPLTVLVEAEAVQRHVLPSASNGALTILLGVNQVALDEELARHPKSAG